MDYTAEELIGGIREYLGRQVVVSVRPTDGPYHPLVTAFGVLAMPSAGQAVAQVGDPDSIVFVVKSQAETVGTIALNPSLISDGNWERAEDHPLGGDSLWVEINGVVVSIGTAP